MCVCVVCVFLKPKVSHDYSTKELYFLKTYTECNVNCNFPMAIKISARCDHYKMVIYEEKKTI